MEKKSGNKCAKFPFSLQVCHPNAMGWGQPSPGLSQPYGLDPYSAAAFSAYGMMSSPYFAASTAAGPIYGHEQSMAIYEQQQPGPFGPVKVERAGH
jgi:hypothetical protein